MMSNISLTRGEQRAQDAIIEAMSTIHNIEADEDLPREKRRTLTYNNDELTSAVHVLQSFVKQHVLHRLDPKEWSDWWESREEGAARVEQFINGS